MLHLKHHKISHGLFGQAGYHIAQREEDMNSWGKQFDQILGDISMHYIGSMPSLCMSVRRAPRRTSAKMLLIVLRKAGHCSSQASDSRHRIPQGTARPRRSIAASRTGQSGEPGNAGTVISRPCPFLQPDMPVESLSDVSVTGILLEVTTTWLLRGLRLL